MKSQIIHVESESAAAKRDLHLASGKHYVVNLLSALRFWFSHTRTETKQVAMETIGTELSLMQKPTNHTI